MIYVSVDRFEDECSGEAFYLARISVADKEAARLGDHKLVAPHITTRRLNLI